jgi:hypothetical protein
MSAEHSNNGNPSLTELANRFGSDKGTVPGDWGLAHDYATVYERFLSVRRFEPLRLLEIGVWKGGSLRMWESYLPNAQIIGIENLRDVVQVKGERVEILIGDGSDQQFLKDALDRFSGRKIDIVIDDASHILDQQVRTFELLFPFLEEGGLYFVEDISGSRFPGGNRGLLPFSDFLDYSWNLAQQTTFFPDYHTSTYHNIRDIRSLSDSERDRVRVSFWNQNLGCVHYFHDLCVFEKLRRQVDLDDLKRTDQLRPTPGLSFRLRREEWRNDGPKIGKPEFDDPSRKIERLERLANTSESERVRVLQEFGVVESTNKILLAEVTQLKGQVSAARLKLRKAWDFIFRLKAKHVAELTRIESELTTSGLPKLRAALADFRRQNNALRLENAERKQAWERMSVELVRMRTEINQLARERDEVRSKIARCLTSSLGLLKRLTHL